MIPYIDYDLCAGCGGCAELYPMFFMMRDELAWVINSDKFDSVSDMAVVQSCPFGAISVE